jgi:hypothetical protein
MRERISYGGGDAGAVPLGNGGNAGAVPLGNGGDAGEDEQKNEKNIFKIGKFTKKILP